MSDRSKALLQAARDYAMLAANTPEMWPELALVALTLSEERVDLAQAAERAKKAIRVAQPGSGWVRLRSGLDWSGNPKPPDHAQLGPPLLAEWAEDGERSHRLRLDPENPDKALLWTCAERELATNESPRGNERLYLREVVCLHGHHRHLPGGQLCYHVFWSGTEDDPQTLARRFDRFVALAPTRQPEETR